MIYSSESVVALSMKGWHKCYRSSNTKFKPLLLSTQSGMPYTYTNTSTEHHISSLHSHLWVQLSAESAFPQPDKNVKFFPFFIIINFKIFSSISSDEIPPRSACKYLQNLYQSVAIHLKYVLLVLLLCLLNFLGL